MVMNEISFAEWISQSCCYLQAEYILYQEFFMLLSICIVWLFYEKEETLMLFLDFDWQMFCDVSVR